jgi:hypothetical protein
MEAKTGLISALCDRLHHHVDYTIQGARLVGASQAALCRPVFDGYHRSLDSEASGNCAGWRPIAKKAQG